MYTRRRCSWKRTIAKMRRGTRTDAALLAFLVATPQFLAGAIASDIDPLDFSAPSSRESVVSAPEASIEGSQGDPLAVNLTDVIDSSTSLFPARPTKSKATASARLLSTPDFFQC